MGYRDDARSSLRREAVLTWRLVRAAGHDGVHRVQDRHRRGGCGYTTSPRGSSRSHAEFRSGHSVLLLGRLHVRCDGDLTNGAVVRSWPRYPPQADAGVLEACSGARAGRCSEAGLPRCRWRASPMPAVRTTQVGRSTRLRSKPCQACPRLVTSPITFRSRRSWQSGIPTGFCTASPTRSWLSGASSLPGPRRRRNLLGRRARPPRGERYLTPTSVSVRIAWLLLMSWTSTLSV